MTIAIPIIESTTVLSDNYYAILGINLTGMGTRKN